MNSIMTNYYPMFRMYSDLRDKMMTELTDNDLRFTPGGTNPTLGELCRTMGEVEQSYIQGFKVGRQDFSYKHPQPQIAESVPQLQAMFAELDRELETTIAGLSEADVQTRQIDRGNNLTLPIQLNLDVYKDAIMIFFGKTSVYFKAMGKTPFEQWEQWIG